MKDKKLINGDLIDNKDLTNNVLNYLLTTEWDRTEKEALEYISLKYEYPKHILKRVLNYLEGERMLKEFKKCE